MLDVILLVGAFHALGLVRCCEAQAGVNHSQACRGSLPLGRGSLWVWGGRTQLVARAVAALGKTRERGRKRVGKIVARVAVGAK